MNLSTFDMMRVWAAVTGLVLAVAYFAGLWLGNPANETLAMLVTGIGGFELFLFGQDRINRRRRHG